MIQLEPAWNSVSQNAGVDFRVLHMKTKQNKGLIFTLIGISLSQVKFYYIGCLNKNFEVLSQLELWGMKVSKYECERNCSLLLWLFLNGLWILSFCENMSLSVSGLL